LPDVERELVEGITPVYNNSKPEEHVLKIEHYQDIELNHLFRNVIDNGMDKGAATWLSVSTQDSPLLVISICSSHKSDDQQFVVTYEPRRSKADAKIYWHELIAIPVKAPIELLETNQQNRDMFAGASIAGDLYIWSIQNSPGNDSPVSEIFSKVSEDSIVGLSFLSNNRLLCCLSDGNIIAYKVNGNQSTVVDKIMKIEPRNIKDPEITCIVSLPEMEDDFVLGLFNGSLLLCSTNQLIPQDGAFNPIVRELHAHKFAIASLKHCRYQGKSFIVSCDLSGEILFHEVDDSMFTPKLVIKLPLPLKSKITCTNDMNHIVCLEKGSVEIFRTSSKNRESIVEGNFEGVANVIELSRNE
jgi:WD repeat-containing protein 34